MSGTVKTITQLLAEFASGQPVGSITPVWEQNFIATMKSLTLNAITPQMYGATGDGSTNDTTAVQNAATAAAAAGVPLYFPLGTYSITSLVITSDVSGTTQQGPPLISGAGQVASVLSARTGATSPLVKLQNVSNTTLSNLGIAGNGLVATCLDTTFNSIVGPSLNNFYLFLSIRDYTSAGWIAFGNNDSTFDHIVMDTTSTGVVAIRLNAGGGNCVMRDMVIFNSTLDYCAQSISLSNCVLQGIRCNLGFDRNQLNLFGGYIYCSQSGSNLNLEVASPYQSDGIGLFGVRMENPNTGGAFIGGAGVLYNGATLIQPALINMTNAGAGTGALSLVASGLPQGSTALGNVTMTGGTYDPNISLASTTHFTITHATTYKSDGSGP